VRIAVLVVFASSLLACTATRSAGGARAEPRSEIARDTDQILRNVDSVMSRQDTERAHALLGDARANLQDPSFQSDPSFADALKREEALNHELKLMDSTQAYPPLDIKPVAVAAKPAEPAPAAETAKPVVQASAPAAAEPAKAPAQVAAPAAKAPAAAAPSAPAPVVKQTPPAEDPAKVLRSAMERLVAGRAGLHGHELTNDDVEKANAANTDVKDALRKLQAAESEDPAAKEVAQGAMKLLDDVKEELDLGKLIADFVAGPGASQKKAAELMEQAKDEASAEQRKDWAAARAAYRACAADSQKMMADSPILNRTALFLSTTRTSPKKVAAACKAEAKALDKKLGKMVATRGRSRPSR
jgi:hypothetical protein